MFSDLFYMEAILPYSGNMVEIHKYTTQIYNIHINDLLKTNVQPHL